MKHPLLWTVGAMALGGIAAAPAKGLARNEISPAAIFRRADLNRDGYVSRPELQSFRERQFDRLDRDHDGLTRIADMPRLMRATTAQAKQLRAFLERADRNRDGRITREEFITAPSRFFDEHDRDRDGRLSQGEVGKVRTSWGDTW